MSAWREIVGQRVRTQRGNETVVYKGRIYVRNTEPYFKESTQEWSEYFVCANDCEECRARVVRFTPLDGRSSYVRRSRSQRTRAHSVLCLPSRSRILLRQARQQLNEDVAQSICRGSRDLIRTSYDAVTRELLRHGGIVYICVCFGYDFLLALSHLAPTALIRKILLINREQGCGWPFCCRRYARW